MRIVCLADTHELHRELIVPPGDLLLHAGDFTFFSQRRSMIDDFNDWLGELPHRHKVVVYGNHEFGFESDSGLRSRLSNAVVLVNEAAKIEGVTIWGSPVTPMNGGVFGLSRAEDRARLYSQIPPETQILLTHTPPFGVLDGQQHAGCPELRSAVIRLRPRLHVFGHVHNGYGTLPTKHTMFVNAALFGEHGDLDKQPIVLDLKDERML
jgi:Icc-related predicted phosphoesterase